jgi:hypothetical protein
LIKSHPADGKKKVFNTNLTPNFRRFIRIPDSENPKSLFFLSDDFYFKTLLFLKKKEEGRGV